MDKFTVNCTSFLHYREECCEDATDNPTEDSPSVGTSIDQDDVVLNAKLPWPAEVRLPTSFRLDVTKVLSSKDSSKVDKKFRRNFIQSTFDHFARYTL